MIIVKNGLEDKIFARYAGADHIFPAGEETPCEDDAARHIFGYGEKSKDDALLRLGWILPGQSKDEAMKKLGKIIFKKAVVTVTAG